MSYLTLSQLHCVFSFFEESRMAWKREFCVRRAFFLLHFTFALVAKDKHTISRRWTSPLKLVFLKTSKKIYLKLLLAIWALVNMEEQSGEMTLNFPGKNNNTVYLQPLSSWSVSFKHFWGPAVCQALCQSSIATIMLHNKQTLNLSGISIYCFGVWGLLEASWVFFPILTELSQCLEVSWHLSWAQVHAWGDSNAPAG